MENKIYYLVVKNTYDGWGATFQLIIATQDEEKAKKIAKEEEEAECVMVVTERKYENEKEMPILGYYGE